MNPSLYTAVLVGLALVLVAMFGFGFYWLATKDRSVLPVTPTPTPTTPSPAAVDEIDEWEACAPYPDHVFHAPYDDAELNDIYPPVGRQEEPNRASHTSDVRHDLHNAIELLTTGPSASESLKPTASSSGPTIRCPRCLSSRIGTRNRARKAGSTIGSVAGATGGMAAALAGAETGAVVGSIAGPVGTLFGGLAGAVIAGLLGSAAGCAAGSAVGGAIDDNVLDNHHCLACGHAFSAIQS
ncbi:hypothetical protein [Burkholderia paludis]|uniref:hypothetical protein n=1 Tax=Burkholderia paludis TaxID=1506587 RepID=UPI001F1733A5|nr:hypothetical protein [Burkholderia paludis]